MGDRLELGSAGIAVTLIEPGSVNTPIRRKAAPLRARLLGALSAAGAHGGYG